MRVFVKMTSYGDGNGVDVAVFLDPEKAIESFEAEVKENCTEDDWEFQRNFSEAGEPEFKAWDNFDSVVECYGVQVEE